MVMEDLLNEQRAAFSEEQHSAAAQRRVLIG